MILVDAAGERVLRNLAQIARSLRAGGAEIGPNRLEAAVQALAAVDIASAEDSYWALRCTLISRWEDIELFDSVFAAFCAGLPEPGEGLAEPQHVLELDSHAELEGAEEQMLTRGELDADRTDDDSDPEEAEADERGARWSALERLHEMDFASYTDAELREAQRLMARLGNALPRRRTRRLRAARDGASLDKRRTLQSAMRADGYALERHWRQARTAQRKAVFVVDISGSMAPYARALIMFLQATVRAGRRVEAFAFGTRLTRITAELRAREPDRALGAAARAVPDWAGGTRIGDNLKLLNDTWGRRGATRGAAVIVLSDGWERGDTDLLAHEMARLSRAAYSLIWVNPLAGDPGYEPLAQGMAAALPYVDHFLPGHNLRSLTELARLLEDLPTERGGTPRRRPRMAGP